MRFSLSMVTMSISRTESLYSGGFPAVTTTQPSGTRCRPKTLFCRNCSMEGASVSEMQLISSRKRMPSFLPVASMRSYTLAIISLMVYSVVLYFTPPYSFSWMKGRPRALCLV